MDIRVFIESDRFALREIYFETRRQLFTWLDCSTFLQTDFDRDTEDEKIWVAIDTNRLIGFVSIWQPDNFVHNLFVHPDFIGRGVGTKLLNVSLNKMGSSVTLKCSKPNTMAKEFYLSRGWRVKRNQGVRLVDMIVFYSTKLCHATKFIKVNYNGACGSLNQRV